MDMEDAADPEVSINRAVSDNLVVSAGGKASFDGGASADGASFDVGADCKATKPASLVRSWLSTKMMNNMPDATAIRKMEE